MCIGNGQFYLVREEKGECEPLMSFAGREGAETTPGRAIRRVPPPRLGCQRTTLAAIRRLSCPNRNI